MPESVLFLTTDLMFASRAGGAAQRAGVALDTIPAPERLVERCREETAALVIVDLSLGGLEIAELVASLRELPHAPRRIIAYGPHVHEAKLQAAATAGCDAVFSRGEFNAQMDRILASANADG